MSEPTEQVTDQLEDRRAALKAGLISNDEALEGETKREPADGHKSTRSTRKDVNENFGRTGMTIGRTFGGRTGNKNKEQADIDRRRRGVHTIWPNS